MNRLQIKEVIEALQELRNQKNGELDASVLAEIDEIIDKLDKLRAGNGEKVYLEGDFVFRILSLIDLLINAATNLAELIRWLLESISG